MGGVTFNNALGFAVAYHGVAGHVWAVELEEGVGGDGGTHAVGVWDAVDMEVGDHIVAHGGAGKGEDSEEALHVGRVVVVVVVVVVVIVEVTIAVERVFAVKTSSKTV